MFSFLVVGALIGKQKGRNIEVMNSFELVFSAIGDDIIIDREYYNLKEEQCEYSTVCFTNQKFFLRFVFKS